MSALDQSLERGLPAAPDAERSILGAILLDNELAPETFLSLPVDAMSLDAHRRLYGAMVSIANAGKPIDQITLLDELTRTKELEAVGGITYMASLTDRVPRRASIEHYVRLVRDKHTLRTIIHVANGTMTSAMDGSGSADEVLDAAEEAILRIRAEAMNTNAVRPVSTFAEDAFREFEASLSAKGMRGLPLGIDNVDSFTGGIHPKGMTVLGGRTGEGKSTIVTQCAYTNASHDVPVILFTPEMTKEQVLLRMAIQLSGVPAWKYAKNMLSQDDVFRVRQTYVEINQLPIYIDETSTITAQEVSARARLAARRNGVKLCIVDYIQLLESRGKDLRAEVSSSSKHLRTLAKEVMPVLALSQMPRPKDVNAWPTKYDLKESGSLENDSAQVIIIRREVDEKNMPTGNDHICVVKNRNGRVGVEPVCWHEDSLTFRPGGVR